MSKNNSINEKVASYAAARRLSISRQDRFVLIVDDETTGRTISSKIVEQVADNIIVVPFDNPMDALVWLDDHHPDLIITDYRMPGMDGIAFIKQVRSRQEHEDIPIMMITVVSEQAIRHEALDAGATAFLTRPIDQVECRTSCRNLLKLHEQQMIVQDRADWLERQVELATEKVVAREKETLLRLAMAGEYKDKDTGNHVVRMAKYARCIAEDLGLSKQECEDIEYAAPMHDIGKIGIPDSILLKPGKLEPAEWEVMKAHTIIGHSILTNSHSRYMELGAVIALNHHEKFDGSGYPNGLIGESIPLVARIVAVADVYDALMSERPYKKAWEQADTERYLAENKGTHFDPICVDALLNRMDEVLQVKAALVD